MRTETRQDRSSAAQEKGALQEALTEAGRTDASNRYDQQQPQRSDLGIIGRPAPLVLRCPLRMRWASIEQPNLTSARVMNHPNGGHAQSRPREELLQEA